ncbi:MAG: hypothetical protein BWK73_18790 [Thiothrix lacustris]|uniref:Uncharacterized protein n=1 Tax=Thiothrix lacustris TaxID=525917 RepID=A0A1Y1QQD9_9GAMM|nr:MAG: hypothetical protein BWK73_18790 [Thiothrix lacustris]
MIHSAQNIDPVSRDLNNYLAAQDQHDIKMERFQAVANREFGEMNYLDIIEYGNNYSDLEFLFDFVIAGKIEEAKSALSNFFETVKDAYIENRSKELEQEEEKERQDDEYINSFEKYDGLF